MYFNTVRQTANKTKILLLHSKRSTKECVNKLKAIVRLCQECLQSAIDLEEIMLINLTEINAPLNWQNSVCFTQNWIKIGAFPNATPTSKVWKNFFFSFFLFYQSTHITYNTTTTILKHYLQNHSTLIKPYNMYNLFLTTTTNNTRLNILYTLHLC